MVFLAVLRDVYEGGKMSFVCLCLSSVSLIGERISQQAIAQLIGDPKYLRFNVLIREDAKV